MTEEEIEHAKNCPDQVFIRILRDPQGDHEFNLSEGQATKLLRARYGDEADAATLRARLSRLSALLDEAEAALGVFARGSEQGIQYVSHIWTGARPAPTVQSDLKRAASVAAKIAKEKSDEA